MPEHTIPESLIDQIKRGRAVLVVGAGIGVPTWKQLLERMNETLAARGGDDEAASKDVAKLLHKGSLDRAAGFLGRALGEATCDAVMAEIWATPRELPPVAAALAKLPIRQIWTTFPGDIIDQALRSESPEGWPSARVLTYRQAGELKAHQRTLFKILGDLDSYVITARSVRTALASAAALREFVRSYYADGTLIFVGFRFGDPDLSALLDRVFGMFEVPAHNHYLLASGVGPVTVDELRHEHRIEVVNLAGKGADDTATQALLDYLNSLAAACEQAGVTMTRAEPAEHDLEGWLEAWEWDAEVARQALVRMEQAARKAGQAERLVDILVGRIERETTASVRAALLRQLAEVFENEVGDPAQAFTALTAALREDPADPTIMDKAEELAEATSNWAELVAEVSAVAGELSDRPLAARYWTRLGRWYDAQLGHAEYAAAAYRQAVKLNPEETAAYAGLAELYRKEQRWAELADVLSEHVAVEREPASQLDLYLALGDLCETQLASTARAIDAYQTASELDPDSEDALAALERLYRRDERWAKLAEVLGKHAALLEAQASDSQRAGVLRREIGKLQAEKLGDSESAIRVYEAALAADAGDVAALQALQRLYEQLGRTEDYLRTLQRLIDASPVSEQATLLLRLAAEIEESDAEAAVECYERVIALGRTSAAAEDAYRAMERLHQSRGAWLDLVAAYERHIEDVKDSDKKIALHTELAELHESKLNDPHRAIDAHRSILELSPEHRGALGALARLYQRTESWQRAVEVAVTHAELEGAAGAAQWFLAGSVLTARLSSLGEDRARDAETYLDKALELAPDHRDAMLALAELYTRQSSWANAVALVSRAEEHTQSRLERIELLMRATGLCEERLDDRERALDFYLRVLALDPEHVEAGERACVALIEKKQWKEAQPILSMLARKSGNSRERIRWEVALGRALEATGDIGGAVERFRAAAERDRDSLDAALGLADALYASAMATSNRPEAPDAPDAKDDESRATSTTEQHWKEADSYYRRVLAAHRAGLADSQVVEIWHRIGVCARSLSAETSATASAEKQAHGEALAEAQDAFLRALELDPQHVASLQALIEVAAERGDFAVVVDARREEIQARGLGGEQKLDRLIEIGEIYQSKLGDAQSALGVYLEALKIRPDSPLILHKILNLYTETGQWRRALDTLASLAEHEKVGNRRAKYRFAAAVIARDELRDTELAVEQLGHALDDDPTSLRTLESMEEILVAMGDYKTLGRAYTRVLKRVGDTVSTDVLLRLWTRLGQISAQHLNDEEAAIAALEVAVSLEPDNFARHEELANLYLDAGEAHRNSAIAELQLLILHEPDRVELYRALSDLYREAGETDKAFCLAQALVFLGAATEVESALYAACRPRQFVVGQRRLTEELWVKSIVHQSEDRVLSALFAALVGPLAALTAQPPSAFGLNPDERAEVGRASTWVVARVFKYASDILGLDPEPRLYIRDDADGLRVANTREGEMLVPSVLVGRPHTGNKEERLLAFEVGKRLSYFRPERYIHNALQPLAKIDNAFDAVLSVTGMSDKALSDDAEKVAMHLRKTVSGALLEQVGALARKLDEQPRGPLLSKWRDMAELTATRVGFILCNDLDIAARLVATESAPMTSLSAKDRLRDLLAYSVSEKYFAVRRHLGLEVKM